MNYQKCYDDLIARARGRKLDEYSEVHHILPKSLGGSDDEGNLVSLTYREHYLAHWLLANICEGRDRLRMLYALHCMTIGRNGPVIAGWRIDLAKRAVRREYLKRLAERRAARKALRAQVVKGRLEMAAKASSSLDAINPERKDDRRALRAMANAWIKGSDPKAIGRLQRAHRKPGTLPGEKSDVYAGRLPSS